MGLVSQRVFQTVMVDVARHFVDIALSREKKRSMLEDLKVRELSDGSFLVRSHRYDALW